MKYFTLHINDSGAIEDVAYRKIKGKRMAVCKLYDDQEFNKLNDILHATNEFVLNQKALSIFSAGKTIPFDLRNAKVLRKEKLFGFFKRTKFYDYFVVTFPENCADECYTWIDFEKSEIFATDENGEIIKITSHSHTLDLISENKSDSTKTYSFEAKKVSFGKNFDAEMDLFTIPLYSWGIYVSERLKHLLENNTITDIGFAADKEKLGEMWKPHFPRIEFNKNDS